MGVQLSVLHDEGEMVNKDDVGGCQVGVQLEEVGEVVKKDDVRGGEVAVPFGGDTGKLTQRGRRYSWC